MEENIQTPNTQPVEGSPTKQPPSGRVEEKPKLKLPILIVSFVLFLVIAATSFAAYVYVNKSSQRQACTAEALICPDGSAVGRSGPKCEFAPCPTTTPDPTANWKTYKNTEYGFSFKYPKEWEYQNQIEYSDSNSINFGIIENEGPGGIKITPRIPPAYVSLRILKYKNSSTSMLNQYIEEKNLKNLSPSITDTTANGIPAKRIEHIGCQSGGCIDVLIFDDDTILDFFAQNGDTELNQILSTFKFTEPSLNPTPTCMERPACLDATPSCMIPEPAEGWCIN